MSQREDGTIDPQREMEADDPLIVILPEDEAFGPEPVASSAPAPEPAPAPAPAPAKPSADKNPVRFPVILERPKSGPAKSASPRGAAKRESDPLPSMEEIEGEIDEALAFDRSGGERFFSMPFVCRAAALGAIVLLALLLFIGREYYSLSLAARPLHHLHRLLRPSGTLGLSLGILSILVMAASLLYLARKHLPSWRKRGTLTSWMGFHILTGLLGPAVALYHAAFVPTSPLGILAVAAMGVVVVSGIVGRYIAVYFPRNLEGRELKFEEIRGRLAIYKKKLAELGVDPALLRLDEPSGKSGSSWLPVSILRVISGDVESRREFRRLREIVRARGKLRIQTELVLFLIKRLCWERQWLVRYGEFRKLVGAWRFLHLWLAVLLGVAIIFHVIVGARFGGLWILRGWGR